MMSRTTAKTRKNGLPKGSGKRERDEADENSAASKKQKQKQQPSHDDKPTPKQQQPVPTTDRPEQVDYDAHISQMDAAILADHLAKSLKRHADDDSSLELEDQYIPSKAIRDTSAFIEPRVAKNLPAYLTRYAGGKDELSSCDDVASPHTIIVTSSGMRAADLTRELRVFATGDSKIAKLFAKHMKLQSSIEFVKKTKIGIAVGTPTRLKELIELDALHAAAIKRFIIDGSYVDQKKRTIFDLKDLYLQTSAMLNLASVKSRLDGRDQGVEILVF